MAKQANRLNSSSRAARSLPARRNERAVKYAEPAEDKEIQSGSHISTYETSNHEDVSDSVREASIDAEMASVKSASPLSSNPKKRSRPSFPSDVSTGHVTKRLKLNTSSRPTKQARTNGRAIKDGITSNLPPMHELSEIFDDMSRKALANGFYKVVEYFGSRKLQIATMCSGTESPVLALNMLCEGLASQGVEFQIEHMFSAEIEPFKQAYIERNFHPPILFRDIEELKKGKGSTAYGADTEVPAMGQVHLLVAGFSCVDFSRLNVNAKEKITGMGLDGETDVTTTTKVEIKTKAKTGTKAKTTPKARAKGKVKAIPFLSRRSRELENRPRAIGESYGTFCSILDYADDYRPPIVILENVFGAPWEKIQATWEAIDYAVQIVKLDTKSYYLPHTRLRGYMICINKKGSLKETQAEAAVGEWQKLMTRFKRPASSTVESFLLDANDPRLRLATDECIRNEMKDDEQGTREVTWHKSYTRHVNYRREHGLGKSRPYTGWTANGKSQMPDYCNISWGKNQVDRIKDTLDISLLHSAKRGFDMSYKARFPDLSQNVDRNLNSTPWGITGCVTPSGMPFSTARGGPLVGLEALALQGLPFNQLHLTKETNSNLQDLAGNAMTSTVVGVAMLSALIVGHDFIPKTWLTTPHTNKDILLQLQQPRNKQNRDPEFLAIDFGPREYISATELMQLATHTIRRCSCESPSSNTSETIKICNKCGHTACERCAGTPQHNYEVMHIEDENDRRQPQIFIDKVTNAFPTRLKLGLNEEMFQQAKRLYGKPIQNWEEFLAALRRALDDEVRLSAVERSEFWLVNFDGPRAKLVLSFLGAELHWEYFVKPDISLPVNHILRQLLKEPVARMKVRSEDVLKGDWQISLPVSLNIPMIIRGEKELKQSWKAGLGLKDYCGDKVWSNLFIGFESKEKDEVLHQIAGTYEWLRRCGMACGSLYRRISDNPGESMFLFLDPERCGDVAQDGFVFSRDLRRLGFGESRPIKAKVGSASIVETPAKGTLNMFRQNLAQSAHGTKWRPSAIEEEKVQCLIFGKWTACTAVLSPIHDKDSKSTRLSTDLIAATGDCRGAYKALLECSTPWSAVSQPGWRRGIWTVVDKINERQVFDGLRWLTSRIPTNTEASADWKTLVECNANDRCEVCAPTRPQILWTVKDYKRSGIRMIPFEDPKQTGDYEVALKARPSPLEIHTKVDAAGMGNLVISLNLQALAHRAIASLPRLPGGPALEISWRLSTYSLVQSISPLSVFGLRDNSQNEEASFEFPGLDNSNRHYELREEQRRSLRWMLNRESDGGPGFVEEEIEEACMPYLGRRAELRVKRKRNFRGGVLADEVGYGKTITTLALIASTQSEALTAAKTSPPGLIATKATLIILPTMLISQWAEETKKFFGGQLKIEKLKDVKELERITVAQIQSADILLIASPFLTDEDYFRRYAAFAALPEPPPSGEIRAFAAWLSGAKERLATHTQELKSEPFTPKFEKILAERLTGAEEDFVLQRTVPSKRYKGKQYIAMKAIAAAREKAVKLGEQSEIPMEKQSASVNMAGLKEARNLGQILGPLFHMFRFHRIVVDEYSYVDSKALASVVSLNSLSRWILSGTPVLADFADVKNIATFLGVNLGIDDDARGILNKQNMKSIQAERTAVETFEAYITTHSNMWHENRQTFAQSFLDHFVRQNAARIDNIPVVTTYHPVKLSAAERAVYEELCIQLVAHEWRICKSAESVYGNDRARRCNKLFKNCTTAPEALLKRAMMVDDDLAESRNPCKDIVKTRKAEIKIVAVAFEKALQEATPLLEQCPEDEKHFRNWKNRVERREYGDPEVSEVLIDLVATACRVNRKKTKTTADRAKEIKVQLRSLSGRLNVQATAWVQAKQALRFFLTVRDVIRWTSGSITADCGHTLDRSSELSILGQCGHTMCDVCRQSSNRKDRCVVPRCHAPARLSHVIAANDLGKEHANELYNTRFGQKIQRIVALVQDVERNDPTEQVLLFVQYNDMMQAIQVAFEQQGLSFYKVSESEAQKPVGDKKMVWFKEASFGQKNWRRVLILNAGNSSAAGHNLTNTNHVIFAAPLLTKRREEFDSAYKQAIGRAKRYGQKKTVNVYHFLALNTNDVTIFEERTGKKTIFREGDNQFDAVDPTSLTASEQLQDWGLRALKISENENEGYESEDEEEYMSDEDGEQEEERENDEEVQDGGAVDDD